MDLTKVKGCYSKELRANCDLIKMYLKEPTCSVQDMITMVKKLIEPAFINAEAKARFTSNLEACGSKEEVDRLCHEAVIHGMWYKSRKQRVRC